MLRQLLAHKLKMLNRYEGNVVHRALTASVKLCAEKVTHPIYPRIVYPMSDMEAALRQMQAGTHIGRLILVPQPGDQVKVISRLQVVNLASNSSTYLITGGLGGLGRAIAPWMVQKGAKNIVLVSRNAQSHPGAASLMQQAKANGCNLQVQNCDVSEENSLLELLGDCAHTMPPIRGVVAGAIVLNASFHPCLSHLIPWCHYLYPMLLTSCFFIMLSYFAGAFGHLSQANYNAGNTLQDALARHRTSLGMPAVSIDLAAVKSAGFVAEADDAECERILKSLGEDVLEIDHVLRIIETAIREPSRASPDDCQIITCLARYGSIIEGSASKRYRRFATVRMADRTAVSDGLAAGNTADATTVLIHTFSSSGISLVDAAKAIAQAIISKLADIFNIAMAEVDASLPMSHYGVDSLVAVELRNWLGSAAKAKVSIFTILQTPSLTEFTPLVASSIRNPALMHGKVTVVTGLMQTSIMTILGRFGIAACQIARVYG
ncbi:short chain dehydrogenase-domain-containing protein [Ilyonectria destructans]|nr:short chain dehydrogenase-domain-containing protein [Ilyonectria destructans]